MKHLHTLLIATLLLSPFSISESQAMEQPLEGNVIIIAHRGASGERPEHTLASYRTSLKTYGFWRIDLIHWWWIGGDDATGWFLGF